MTATTHTHDPKWKQPGDFLYHHPYSDEWIAAWAQDDETLYPLHVRPMFEEVADHVYRWQVMSAAMTVCTRCEVGWLRGADGPNCWVCGAPGTGGWDL